VRRFLLFVAIGILIAGALDQISKSVPPAARLVFLGMLHHASDIEALTVGTSISTAVDFPTWGAPGWHMWTPGSDLLENEYMVRTAAPALPKLRVVFIAVPPVAFQWLSTARGAPEVRRQQYLATGPLLSNGTIDHDWRDLAIAWALPLIRDDQWRDPIADGLVQTGLRVEQPSTLMTREGRWLPLTTAANIDARAAAARRSAPTVFGGVLATLAADPDAPRRLAMAPGRIARFLGARGVRAVFYTPPVAPEYEAIFDRQRPREITDARVEMRRIAAQQGLIYVDLSRDPALVAALNGLFYDPLHLTVAGASVFTARLRQELQARHALDPMTPSVQREPPQ